MKKLFLLQLRHLHVHRFPKPKSIAFQVKVTFTNGSMQSTVAASSILSFLVFALSSRMVAAFAGEMSSSSSSHQNVTISLAKPSY